MINEERIYSKWLIFIVSIFPIIDLLNGILLDSGSRLPIGSLYRIVLFILLVGIFLESRMLTIQPFGIILILSVLLLIAILSIQTVFFNDSFGIFFNDIGTVIKYLLWLLIAQIFAGLETILFTKMMIWIDIFFTFGMLIPYVLGFGNFTYENSGAGYKSFFFATNDLTYAFTILCTLLIFVIISYFDLSNWSGLAAIFVLYCANIFCLLLIGTKTGIVFSLVSLISTLFYLLFFKSEVPYSIKFLLAQFFIIGAIFTAFWGKSIFIGMIQGTIDRLTYFYDLYDGNWIKILSSSRSIYFEDAVTNFKLFPGNHWIFLFGFGFSNRWTFFGRQGGYIEMDFLDTFFSLGMIGLLVFLIPLFYLLYRSVKYHFYNKYLFLVLVTLGFAATSGHVFYSALSSTLFGLVASRLLISKRIGEENENTNGWSK